MVGCKLRNAGCLRFGAHCRQVYTDSCMILEREASGKYPFNILLYFLYLLFDLCM